MNDKDVWVSPLPVMGKKKGPNRKIIVPIWMDPEMNEGDIIISYHIPTVWPEDAHKYPGVIEHVVSAVYIGKAVLPKHMTKDEASVFLASPEGQKWLEDWYKKGHKMLSKMIEKAEQ